MGIIVFFNASVMYLFDHGASHNCSKQYCTGDRTDENGPRIHRDANQYQRRHGSMIDWSAHEIWEVGYADNLSGRNWLTTKQYAIELLAAGTLVSLGGTGSADMGWVSNPAWQNWTSQMMEETRKALEAIEARDQEELRAAGERLINACEGCHTDFKPDIPTEGILHVPHHEYEEPLTPQ